MWATALVAFTSTSTWAASGRKPLGSSPPFGDDLRATDHDPSDGQGDRHVGEVTRPQRAQVPTADIEAADRHRITAAALKIQ